MRTSRWQECFGVGGVLRFRAVGRVAFLRPERGEAGAVEEDGIARLAPAGEAQLHPVAADAAGGGAIIAWLFVAPSARLL